MAYCEHAERGSPKLTDDSEEVKRRIEYATEQIFSTIIQFGCAPGLRLPHSGISTRGAADRNRPPYFYRKLQRGRCADAYARMLIVMDKVHANLVEGVTMTQRELFYHLKSLGVAKSPDIANKAVQGQFRRAAMEPLLKHVAFWMGNHLLLIAQILQLSSFARGGLSMSVAHRKAPLLAIFGSARGMATGAMFALLALVASPSRVTSTTWNRKLPPVSLPPFVPLAFDATTTPWPCLPAQFPAFLLVGLRRVERVSRMSMLGGINHRETFCAASSTFPMPGTS